MKQWILVCMFPCFAIVIAHGASPRATVSSSAAHAIMEMLLDDDVEGMRKELEAGLSPNALWPDDAEGWVRNILPMEEARGSSILKHAFLSKAERIVRLMFEKGASPFLVDCLGTMPIQWAYESGQSNLVECVRASLPAPETLDADGLTNRIQQVLSPNWISDDRPTPVDKVIWTDRPLPYFDPQTWTEEDRRKSDFVVLVVQTNGVSIPFRYEAVGDGTKKSWGASLVRLDGFLVMEGPWADDY